MSNPLIDGPKPGTKTTQDNQAGKTGPGDAQRDDQNKGLRAESKTITPYQLAKLTALVGGAEKVRPRVEKALKLYLTARDVLDKFGLLEDPGLLLTGDESIEEIKMAERLRRMKEPVSHRFPFREAAIKVGYRGEKGPESLAALMTRHGVLPNELEAFRRDGLQLTTCDNWRTVLKAERSETGRKNRMPKSEPSPPETAVN